MSDEFELGAEEETAGGGGGNFSAAPRGIYSLQVANMESDVTKTGDNKGAHLTKLELEISDEGENFGKKVWHNLVWIPKGKRGHGMLVHFLHALGLPFDGKVRISEVESEMQGRQVRALLEVDTYEKEKDGKVYVNEKNVIRAVYTEAHPEPDDLPPPPAARNKAPARGNPSVSVAAGQRPVGGANRTSEYADDLESVPF